jgi:hypothetical protein
VSLVVGVRTIDEAALVVLGGFGRKRLVLRFTRKVLTAADEGQRPLDGRVVLWHPGLDQ